MALIIDVRKDRYAALYDAIIARRRTLEPMSCPEYEIELLKDTRNNPPLQRLYPEGTHWPERWSIRIS